VTGALVGLPSLPSAASPDADEGCDGAVGERQFAHDAPVGVSAGSATQ